MSDNPRSAEAKIPPGPSLEYHLSEQASRLRKLVYPDGDPFWDEMNEAAETSRGLPEHAKAGINLNPQHFETYEPRPNEAKDP